MTDRQARQVVNLLQWAVALLLAIMLAISALCGLTAAAILRTTPPATEGRP